VVKIACLAQLVNTIAPIMTEPGGRAWIQTIYYPFLYASRFGRGSSLRVSVESPTYACSVGDAIPYVDASATLSADQSEIVLFLINRSLEEQQLCRISLANTASAAVLECVSLNGFSHDSINTADVAPVQPKTLSEYTLHDGVLELALPKFSWNMVRIHVGAAD
jgi:alpha-N-arabinofuranosidase